MRKTALLLISFLALSFPAVAGETTCPQIGGATEKSAALLDPPAVYTVAGEGRLYFYTAPHEQCRSKKIFVIPGDELIAYTAFKEWYSVMYTNPKRGEIFEGWVRTDRLRMTGTIRPKY